MLTHFKVLEAYSLYCGLCCPFSRKLKIRKHRVFFYASIRFVFNSLLRRFFLFLKRQHTKPNLMKHKTIYIIGVLIIFSVFARTNNGVRILRVLKQANKHICQRF